MSAEKQHSKEKVHFLNIVVYSESKKEKKPNHCFLVKKFFLSVHPPGPSQALFSYKSKST